jgi:hypothetical protein
MVPIVQVEVAVLAHGMGVALLGLVVQVVWGEVVMAPPRTLVSL